MDYYNGISRGYEELHKDEQLNKLAVIKGSIKISKSAKLADVGCGTGISSDFNCFVVGIDPSIQMLKHNKRLKVNSSAENLPFKESAFDFVVSVTSMHNFSNIKKSISEMKRIGKQYFVFSVLKKSKRFGCIKGLIESNFLIDKVIEEEKDAIFLCQKHSALCR